jgi:four helix bundle protein
MANSRGRTVTYEEWKEQVPEEIRGDPLWEMKAYRLALFLHDLAWEDCARLAKDRRGKAIAGQLIRSAGSISANIEEGYGRGFGRQFALFLRYSLGSTRETRGWYYRGRRLLPPKVVKHRYDLLSQVTALIILALKQQERYRPPKPS